jgi:hypothetical protein
VGNPSATYTTAYPDNCGRFNPEITPDITAPFIAVATANLNMPDMSGVTPYGDLYVETGVARPYTVGQAITGLNAYVLRHATDAKWSSSAGVTPSFGTQGVYVSIFLSGAPLDPYDGTPTSGVQIAIDNPSGTGAERDVNAAQDFYFTDSSPLVRTTASASQDRTGTNGTGLYIMQPNLSHKFSGTLAEPAGDCWAFNLAATPANVAFVQEKTAIAIPGTTDNPCQSH